MKAVHILLVEDNAGDILLTTEALEESRIINKVSTVKNGKDAIDFVLRQNDFKDAESPDMVLLDINLPLKNGHEVLQIIKSNEYTKQIPVIMLTTSSSDEDVSKAYKQHANCYITKPVEVVDFLRAIATIEDFWLNIVRLPSKENP